MSKPVIPLAIFFGLAVLFVGLRLYTRFVLIRSAGAEDYLVAASLVASAAWFIAHVVGSFNGFGVPPAEVDPASQLILRKTVWFGPSVWGLSSALCKLSIVWQYRRIFPNLWVLRACNIMTVCLVIYACFSFFGAIFLCIPIQAGWGEGVGRCMNRSLFYFLCSGFNVVADCVIYALPVPLIGRLQIPKNQKKALMFVFTFGAFVVIASIVRLVSLAVWVKTPVNSADSLVSVENVAIWSGIEMNASIICACLAVLRPLVTRILPEGFFSARGSSSKRSWGYSRKRVKLGSSHGALRMHSVSSVGRADEAQDEENGARTDRGFEMSILRASADGSEHNLVTGERGESLKARQVPVDSVDDLPQPKRARVIS